MKEILETVTSVLGWNFQYGRTDFQNLRQVLPTDFETYLFLDPVEEVPEYSSEGSGALQSITYKGSFMVLRNSHLDELYDDSDTGNAKYQRYIQPLKEEVRTGDFYYELNCTHELVINWNIKEVVNVFSDNLDGVLVNYTIKNHNIN